jgi:hypothetical protein
VSLSAPVILWMVEAVYGLVVGAPTLRRALSQRRAIAYFADHPGVLPANMPVVVRGGRRDIVARFLVWSELVRLAIQVGFLLIGFGAIFATRFARVLNDSIQVGLIVSSGLLDVQAHVARWMWRSVAQPVKPGKGEKP